MVIYSYIFYVALSKSSNFRYEYLREIEAISENALTWTVNERPGLVSKTIGSETLEIFKAFKWFSVNKSWKSFYSFAFLI